MDKYRPNVAAIIVNEQNQILLCKRSDERKSGWQLPQGGIKKDETPEEALEREVIEETGITSFKIEQSSSDWHCYEWPKERQDRPGVIGQIQKYFMVRVDSKQIESLKLGDEFSECEWVDGPTPLERVVDFKRPVYEKIFREFSLV